MSVYTGLDFGTSTTRICTAEGGILLREPSCAAVDSKGSVVAVGTDTFLVEGRTPGAVTIRRPIRDSVAADFNLTAELLDRLLEAAVPKKRKQILAAVRCGVGEDNRALIKNALLDCRVSKVDFIDAPFAAFEGFYIDDNEKIPEQEGVILCDIGGGSVESVYMRDGEILRTETYFGGGTEADSTICAYLRRHYGIAIPKLEAQAAKHKLDLNGVPSSEIPLAGVDTSTGLPKRVTVQMDELIKCSAPIIKSVAECINAVLTNLPRYAGKPAEADRILLTGKGAELSGLSEYIAEELGTDVPVEAAEEPSDCVIRGLLRIISSGR